LKLFREELKSEVIQGVVVSVDDGLYIVLFSGDEIDRDYKPIELPPF
jgi:hypothetical protein